MVYVKMVNAGYKQPRPQGFSLKNWMGRKSPGDEVALQRGRFAVVCLVRWPLNGTEA